MESLTKQLAHAEWANASHVQALERLAAPPPRALRWMAHVLAAEELWQERILQSGRKAVVWPDLTVAECRPLAALVAARWHDILAILAPDHLATPIRYTNSLGEAWESSVHDILVHICLHGSHHRGQITAELRANGATPPYTDYIHAVRQGFIA